MADMADVHLKVPVDLFARLYQLERDGKGSVGKMIVDALEAAYPAAQSAPEEAPSAESPPERDAPATE